MNQYTSRHKLSNIDELSRTANCAVCGPGSYIRVHGHKSNGEKRFSCAKVRRTNERNWRSRCLQKGICINCGEPVKEPSKIWCLLCYNKQQQRLREWQKKNYVYKGRHYKVSDEDLIKIFNEAQSLSEFDKKGGSGAARKRIIKLGLDIEVLRKRGQERLQEFSINTKKTWQERLVLGPPDTHKTKNSGRHGDKVQAAMIESGIPYKCGLCKITHWMNAPLRLNKHHLNENRRDNRRENLCFLCPNCHVYFHTRNKVRKQILIEKLKLTSFGSSLEKPQLNQALTSGPPIEKVLEIPPVIGPCF
jgi:hypothetical protein